MQPFTKKKIPSLNTSLPKTILPERLTYWTQCLITTENILRTGQPPPPTTTLPKKPATTYMPTAAFIITTARIFLNDSTMTALSDMNKSNLQLAEKNLILDQQKTEIEAQRDEIEIQRDEIATQRNEIVSSVTYAQRIQRAAVSSQSDVHAVFPESFVFYRPRDIVSGDFYRCGRCGKYSVIVRHGEVISLKGDRMLVGRHSKEKEHFQTFTERIKPGDMVYMFSDGIQDQFGGPESKKFSLRQLIDTLQSSANLPAAEQCSLIEQTISDWRADRPQIDDMTMVGIRVG